MVFDHVNYCIIICVFNHYNPIPFSFIRCETQCESFLQAQPIEIARASQTTDVAKFTANPTKVCRFLEEESSGHHAVSIQWFPQRQWFHLVERQTSRFDPGWFLWLGLVVVTSVNRCVTKKTFPQLQPAGLQSKCFENWPEFFSTVTRRFTNRTGAFKSRAVSLCLCAHLSGAKVTPMVVILAAFVRQTANCALKRRPKC